MDRIEWTWERVPRMGGAVGSAYTNTLNAAGMPHGALLAREAIQNAVDAKAGSDEPVRVCFRLRRFRDEEFRRFASTGILEGLRQRLAHVRPAGADEVLDGLGREELSVLYVEDENTVGLGGPLEPAPNAHFWKLLLSLGVEDKAYVESGSGGSYGFGKGVYSLSSKLRTVVAYSCFAPTPETGRHHKRLMACAYLKQHTRDGVAFTGRGWWGSRVASAEDVVEPFVDDEADRLAEALGFEVRPPDRRGASIAILGCVVDVEEIVRGVEDYWWPLLEDGDLEVEVSDEDRVLYPRPRSRRHLRPFLQAYDLVLGKAEPVPAQDGAPREEVRSFNRFEGRSLGSLALVAVDDDLEDEERAGHVDCVALIRAPRMVVSYWRPLARTSGENVCGVFVADDDVDTILKLSEPGEHDKWDPESERLERRDAEVVKSILMRIRRRFGEFKRALVPPPPKGDARFTELAKALGAAFRVRGRGTPGVEAREDPVEVRFGKQHVGDDGYVCEIRVRASEHARRVPLHVRPAVCLYVLKDDVRSRERLDDVDTTVELQDEAGEWKVTDQFVVGRDDWVRLRVRAPIPRRDWLYSLQVAMEVQES